MNGTCKGKTFLSRPLGSMGRVQKVKYHLIAITKSFSKNFKPNFMCLLTNEKYKTYQTRFSFSHLGHASGVVLGGTGKSGVKNLNFLKFNLICVWVLT